MPSLFFSSLFCLKSANESTASSIPHLATFFTKASGRSHFDPKLDARSVSVSFVWQAKKGWDKTQISQDLDPDLDL